MRKGSGGKETVARHRHPRANGANKNRRGRYAITGSGVEGSCRGLTQNRKRMNQNVAAEGSNAAR